MRAVSQCRYIYGGVEGGEIAVVREKRPICGDVAESTREREKVLLREIVCLCTPLLLLRCGAAVTYLQLPRDREREEKCWWLEEQGFYGFLLGCF